MLRSRAEERDLPGIGLLILNLLILVNDFVCSQFHLLCLGLNLLSSR